MRTGLTRRASGSGSGINYANFYLTFVPLEDATFTFTQRGTGDLYYSIDGGAWTECQSGVATPTVQVGSEIRWKGELVPIDSGTPVYDTGPGVFSSTGNFEAKGNISSIVNGDNYVGRTTASTRMFTSLFYGNTKLVNAENLCLPFTSLTQYVYSYMFYGCSSMVKGPKILPATLLWDNCYNSMFYNCSSLISAPEISAKIIGAQSCLRMFRGCTSLTTAPVLYATELKIGCYREMFYSCDSLIKAPDLIAPTLVGSCYMNMFSSCNNINYIKCLATNISASNCTNGWVNGVATTGTFVKAEAMTSWTTGNNGIPTNWLVEDAETYENEYLMFIPREDATFTFTKRGTGDDIQYKIDDGEWTTLASDVASPTVQTGHVIRWKGQLVANVDSEISDPGIGGYSATGQFDVKGNPLSLVYGDNFVGIQQLEIQKQFALLFESNQYIVNAKGLSLCSTNITAFCYQNMFQNCTSLISAPKLPATNLRSRCYFEMFKGCSSLTTAPELPGKDLITYCYYHMFRNCSSLNYIRCLAETVTNSNAIAGWTYGVATTGTFVKLTAMNDIPVDSTSGIPTGWTVFNQS